MTARRRGAAFNLAEHPDPRGRAALRGIHAELKDQKRADVVALAFYESKDPAERALTAAACQRLTTDAMCISPMSSEDVQQPEPPPDPEELEAAKALIAKLAAAGFSKVSAVDPAKAAGGGAGAVLLLAGHAWWFDVETGFFPNYHDSLMRRLASLVSPALDDAVFEETAPPIGRGDRAVSAHRLHRGQAAARRGAQSRRLVRRRSRDESHERGDEGKRQRRPVHSTVDRTARHSPSSARLNLRSIARSRRGSSRRVTPARPSAPARNSRPTSSRTTGTEADHSTRCGPFC